MSREYEIGSTAAVNFDRKYRPDWLLFLMTLVLLSFGIIMVFDASYPTAIEQHHGDQAFWVKRQALWALVGLVIMFASSRIRFWKWQGWANISLIASFLMLIAVHFVGHNEMGAQRWIGFGPVRIQPSEVAKIALVLFLARQITVKPDIMTRLWSGFVPLVGVSLLSIAFVAKQPDLGTAITMLLTVVLVLFAGGAKKRWIATMLALCFAAGFASIMHKGNNNNFQLDRLTTYLHPEDDPQDKGFQILHSRVALGSGGLTGVGFGESREKRQGGLPIARTDFIFAIVGEEFGLLGTGLVLIGFIILGARGFHIAQRTKDPFGSLLAVGITGMISIQALLNVGVVTGALPTTGIPLPFISYGGTSLVTVLFGIGLLLNISQNPFRRDMRPAARKLRGDREDLEPTPAPRPARSSGSGSGKANNSGGGNSAGIARARLLRYHEGT